MEKLYADKRIFVCLKPVGVASTDQPGGLPELVRRELGEEKACVRTVHRLDQVVGGVMVLARSRVAAQLLSEQMRQGRFEKEYLAVAQGSVAPTEGTLRDLLRRDKARRKTFVTDTPGQDVREAVLGYRVLAQRGGYSLLRIKLGTGRTHQIRCQFAHRGWPLAGDEKYGAQPCDMEGIALWSTSLSFDHPQTGERLRFAALPPRQWPWTMFQEELTAED
jgi:23S rRNA pseudouridine1911/1915/1917 synthase